MWSQWWNSIHLGGFPVVTVIKTPNLPYDNVKKTVCHASLVVSSQWTWPARLPITFSAFWNLGVVPAKDGLLMVQQSCHRFLQELCSTNISEMWLCESGKVMRGCRTWGILLSSNLLGGSQIGKCDPIKGYANHCIFATPPWVWQWRRLACWH